VAGVCQLHAIASIANLYTTNCPRAITPDELQQIEDRLNGWIAEAHPAQIAVMPLAAAKAKGAISMFGEKYADEVRVIDFPGVSIHIQMRNAILSPKIGGFAQFIEISDYGFGD
jgi:alanyl-tRNA synthetase